MKETIYEVVLTKRILLTCNTYHTEKVFVNLYVITCMFGAPELWW